MSNQMAKRRLIINKDFQYKFCLYMIIPVLLSTLTFYASIEYFFYQMSQLGVQSSLSPEHPFYTFIKIQKFDMMEVLLFASIVLMVLMIIWGLFISRRISGPLFKLTNYMDHVSQTGVKEDLVFRKNDFFQEIPNSVNKMIKKLKS